MGVLHVLLASFLLKDEVLSRASFDRSQLDCLERKSIFTEDRPVYDVVDFLPMYLSSQNDTVRDRVFDSKCSQKRAHWTCVQMSVQIEIQTHLLLKRSAGSLYHKV